MLAPDFFMPDYQSDDPDTNNPFSNEDPQCPSDYDGSFEVEQLMVNEMAVYHNAKAAKPKIRRTQWNIPSGDKHEWEDTDGDNGKKSSLGGGAASGQERTPT